MLLDQLEGRLLLTSTTLNVSTASGTYGGTTTLSAHLTDSGSNNIAGEIVDFQLGGTELGTTTTDGSGMASISNVSLAGINAGTYVGDVTAEFTGDAGAGYTASSGANDLTVTTAPPTIRPRSTVPLCPRSPPPTPASSTATPPPA